MRRSMEDITEEVRRIRDEKARRRKVVFVATCLLIPLVPVAMFALAALAHLAWGDP